MPLTLSPLELAWRMGLALAMAVVMGLAFEGVYKRQERTSPGGIRTFPMLAVLGVLLYLLEPRSLVPYTAGLGAVSLWLYGHTRREHSGGTSSPGLMVPAANLLAYLLGATAMTQPEWVVVAATVAAVLLLESRERLHRFVLAIPSDEIYTLGTFLILVGVVLPLAPDRAIVRWTPLTPFKAWLALVAVSSLSYASYLLHRFLPGTAGILWSAILGGAYSSTATTVALARQQQLLAERSRSLSAGILAATAMMYLRIQIVVALFNGPLARTLLPALLASFLLAGALAAWQWLRQPAGTADAAGQVPAANPLQLGTALTFTVLFIVLSVASSGINHAFGQAGVYALAAVTGLADVDPFVLSLAEGGVTGMTLRAAAAAILIAVSANNVLKGGYALALCGPRRAGVPASGLLALAGLGAGLALLYLAA